MANKQTPAGIPMEEHEEIDQPTTSAEAVSTPWAPTPNIPGQTTRWMCGTKEARAAQQAFPDKRLEEKRALAFLKSDVIAWIKRATTGEQVPCTLDTSITDEEWQTNTIGWEFRRFLADLNGAPTGGYDTVAISKDKQKAIIRCDGPISIESLDWLITTQVVPTFAKVHHIIEEQIQEGRRRGETTPDVCVEIDPTKEQTCEQPPKPLVVMLSKEDEAYVLSHRLLDAFTKDPELLNRIREASKKKEQEPPKKTRKKEKQDSPKKMQKREEDTYDRVLTNITWGFCQSTFDLSWKTTVKQGRYMRTVLKTTEGQEVYIQEQVPTEPVMEQEPEVVHPQEDKWLPKIEYVGDTSSDEEMPTLEDVTDENRDEIYARAKEYQETRGIEPEVDQLRVSMLRYFGLRESCRHCAPTAPVTVAEGGPGTSHETQRKLMEQCRRQRTPIAPTEGAAGTSQMQKTLKKQHQQPTTTTTEEEEAGTSSDKRKNPKKRSKKKE